jgi:anti-anti-sigma factor
VAQSTQITVGRTADGYLLCLEGRATMRESPAVAQFVTHLLETSSGSLTIDLAQCQYIDSTFLGCLLALHRRFGMAPAPRFLVARPSERCRQSLSSTRLDVVLHIVDAAPDVVGDLRPVPLSVFETRDLSLHVMECHRLLAELGGPLADAFARVADQLARELGPTPPP